MRFAATKRVAADESDAADDAKSSVCVQTRVSYRRPDGSEWLRVATARRRVTRRAELANKDLDVAIVACASIRRAGQCLRRR